MDTLLCYLVLLTLPQLVVPQAASLTTVKAVVELVSGDSRIFSGESVRLRCTIHDEHKSTWRHQWFRGSEQLAQSGEDLVLWKARVKDSGKFYCQGVRGTAIGDMYTAKSLPVEINVDGGWAILQVPHHPGLVGNNVNVTCRVRGNPLVHEVVLYKNGVEVLTQKGPDVYLTNLSVEDQGMYSCRASWDIEGRTRSAISVETLLQVLEVVSQPVLEIVTDQTFGAKMKLICHVHYNAPAPAPPINYYFYNNNNRLGVATSENHDLVRRTPGQYSCKAKVPQLNLSRSSEPKSFGLVKGGQPQRPRVLWPLAPPVSSPNLSLPAAAESTAARPSPDQPTAAPSFIQPTEASTRPSRAFPSPSKPEPRPLPSTVQSHNHLVNPVSFDASTESGDGSGDFDFPEGSADTSG
ncbi:hypothetical protein Q5P01_010306 [Channa striata]|uniref:Ig-like domain-containing protein n=1 Tax=Channa striata TaxID=64152 RepID=A0AA88MYC9_CHASR|nr:hypothetical protein Q5P01_010306 [Channa striata]